MIPEVVPACLALKKPKYQGVRLIAKLISRRELLAGLGAAAVTGFLLSRVPASTAEASTTASPVKLEPPFSSDLPLESIIDSLEKRPELYGRWPSSYFPLQFRPQLERWAGKFAGEKADFSVVATPHGSPVWYAYTFPWGGVSREQSNILAKWRAADEHRQIFTRNRYTADSPVDVVIPDSSYVLKEPSGADIPVLAVKAGGILWPATLTTYLKGIQVGQEQKVFNAQMTHGFLFEKIDVKDGKIASSPYFGLWVFNPEQQLTFTLPSLLSFHGGTSRIADQHINADNQRLLWTPKGALEDRVRLHKWLQKLFSMCGVGLNWQDKLSRDWKLGMDRETLVGESELGSDYTRSSVALADRAADIIRNSKMTGLVESYMSGDFFKGIA